MPALHMAVRVTAMASGTSNTAMAALRMPGYRCSVYLAMLSRRPAGSGKCCASNSWYQRYSEWNPSFPNSSYLQAQTLCLKLNARGLPFIPEREITQLQQQSQQVA